MADASVASPYFYLSSLLSESYGILSRYPQLWNLQEVTSQKAILLVDELATLYRWLKHDILSLAGPSYADRQQLLKFLAEQLRLREALYRHKIEPVRRYLENHSDNLLEFVPMMESCFYEIAHFTKLPKSLKHL